MKKNSTMMAVIACAILLLSFQSAAAQKKWSFELKPGVNFPVKKLGNANLTTGFGFEGTLAYNFMPHLGAYAGWSWNKFAADKSFVGNDVEFEETGYCFGLQFIHPIKKSNIRYMIKGGGTYNHIETENSAGKIIYDTGHGFGWQAGGGIAIPIGKRWLLVPEVRYRSLSREINTGDGTTPIDLNYLSAGVGISNSF